ncbi:PPi-type phosphoenolpyruvate carboxykinase [Propionibacterium freudenreichii]|uniref:PPi-type phosphoenolpyruvate carboxykinase n=1 Tax=Propionibacterium freudenreichii subsp. freudenreichii TaxID=66712 RepID=PEPCK_PROFF|nr:PPi-type phosphoenolpyruvate carboxykinase [Propionibacterium freudenreichii]A0A0C5URS1.1 RecName: Full=PPi-type phosphoenolpyruvate carboxykinase; Short=PPi-PEPCK; Short=PfPEPCK; AltName: Full=Diphosphate-dependent phosphoenolpyruvate carboxykinase; AltName: Full=PEP carboxyphosphotransferase [Propionibacterium freudenreichii subsp. freudenreichii]AJQ89945.1 Hypothetical protein RM25_0213 [Propionibacterium freudenreichii subsp. freudenreichii]MDK9341295.1 PPi-type phosphoenolpyruvate carbox
MSVVERRQINAAINLRLSLLGLPHPDSNAESPDAILVEPLLARQRELSRRLKDRLSAPDLRIQRFLDDYLADCDEHPQLPRTTLVLDEPGLARGLSLPVDGDEFHSDIVASYRLVNGVLHNPKHDRRTTAGVFHISTGGLPIPQDKVEVDKNVYARILARAFQAPDEELALPYTANLPEQAHCWASLLMRPTVLPAVPGRTTEKSYEVHFIVPGGLMCNLDFVEGIFGNAGDPYLPENDASLDPDSWTGHTGCVILAPHLTTMTKKSLGMPHYDDATERQRRDGQCWRHEDDLYNDGKAFKVCARDERGVIVTVIADNYFGYCKKEVKTQISYSANLLGGAEEEHSGGAEVYPAWNLNQDFTDRTPDDFTLADVISTNRELLDVRPEGYAVYKPEPNIVFIPEHSHYSMRTQTISWTAHGAEQTIKLLAGKHYLSPDGYRIHAKHREMDATQWHLIGTSSRAVTCHKPATVSGGGKSEISKSISDAFVFGNAFSHDIDSAMDQVQALFDTDFTNRFADASRNGTDHRPVLSIDRSLGSVIKLLTPSIQYNDEYNAFLEGIEPDVKELAFTVKRYYLPEWGEDWRSHFTVGIMNGRHGNMVRLDGKKIITNMLRVGFREDGSWRLFTLRPDYSPAVKVQTEDDITASTVTPPWEDAEGLPRKYVTNCEHLLFQRPDDAIHRGYDKQAEFDLASGTDTFISNFEPLTHEQARDLLTDVQAYSEFTKPVRKLIERVAAMPDDQSPEFWVCSDDPRHLPDGGRSKNPRYLQVRPTDSNPELTTVADVAGKLARKLPLAGHAPQPIDVVAAGRRNNPPEDKVPALCAYNPLHYMELPELFMEYISSMTGKSPSTTGAGSEGALTKGPFNALPAVYDLNAALLSYALTDYDGWLSSAGYIGPNARVDHDISMLIPELFSHMGPNDRNTKRLISEGYLEKMQDFDFDGHRVLASRLGYRINDRFVTHYFGRIFLHPDVVFSEEMLRPELQDEKIFADSIDVIVKTHQRVAQMYFDDGTVSLACPPIRALLEIMAHGASAEGWTLDSPEFRKLFERESVLASDWYAQRLDAKQAEDVKQAEEGVERLKEYIGRSDSGSVTGRLHLADRLRELEAQLTYERSPEYRQSLVGTLGRQPRFV